jgi:hypothetical protein
MTVTVRPEATVEEVIGYVLYVYTEQAWQPPAVPAVRAYALRMVEDDGEIDDDFPGTAPPTQTRICTEREREREVNACAYTYMLTT